MAASNERKIEQVGKLSLLHVAGPSSPVIEHAAVRLAKMSLRLQPTVASTRVETTCGGDPPFIHPGEGLREKYPRPCGKTADRSYGEINSRQPSCTQLSACSTRPPLFHRLIGSAVAYSKVSGPRSLKAFHDHGFSIVARPRMGHTYFVVKVRMCEMMERQDLRFFVNNS